MSKLKTTVFVGSCSKSHDIDIEVRAILEVAGAQVIQWRGSFEPGAFGLDALEAITSKADAAILVVTPDAILRDDSDVESLAPRDNVILELGFYVAKYGRARTICLLVTDADGSSAKLPSDLSGLTVLKYVHGRTAGNEREIRQWLERTSHLVESRRVQSDFIREAQLRLEQIPSPWLPYVGDANLGTVLAQLSRARGGTIQLRSDQYYSYIFNEMAMAMTGSEVRAVASISPSRWHHAEEQRDWAERNIQAAGRGALIRRVFVINTANERFVRHVAARMKAAKIGVRAVGNSGRSLAAKLQDIVMFSDTANLSDRAYCAYADPDFPIRIQGAEMIISPEECAERKRLFDLLWSEAVEMNCEGDPATPPPGYSMRSRHLDQTVITCEEAAAAKNMDLADELKSLVLETSVGLCVAHLPGDRQLSLRKVKRLLGCDQAKLASKEVLQELGLQSGTVCAVMDPVWSMRSLVSDSVLSKVRVSTNNSTLVGYFVFEPSMLLDAASVEIGDILLED